MPVPTDRTLETLATKLEDDKEMDLLINFMTGLLDWLPEELMDSFEMFSHLWITPSTFTKNQPTQCDIW